MKQFALGANRPAAIAMHGERANGTRPAGEDLQNDGQATLAAAEAADTPTGDELLDTWIDAWMELVEELVAARRSTDDAALVARSRQARRLAAADDRIAFGRRLMNLDDANGRANFHHMRMSVPTDYPTFDRAWFAHLRRQEAAWNKLGPDCEWSGSTVPFLKILADAPIAPHESVADLLRGLRTAKPSAKWSERAAAVASSPHGPAVRRATIEWLNTLPVLGSATARARLWPDVAEYRNFRRRVIAHSRLMGGPQSAALIAFFEYMAPFRIYDDGSGGFGTEEMDPAILSEEAALLVRGAAWMLVNWRDAETITALRATAETMLLKLASGRRGVNYRSLAAANACILALGEIATPEAVQALGRIKLKVRDERLSKQIAKAMELAAAHAGMTVTDLQELAVPDFGLDDVGVKRINLGDFTATLRATSTTDVAVEIERADGKAIKSVPAAIKADEAASAALKKLKDAAKSITQALPVHRQRVESLYLARRSWTLPVWRERFLDHPLVGTLARRLIWAVAAPGGITRSLIWHEGHLVDAQDKRAERLGDDCIVTLWHPLEATDQDAAAWRAFLMRHKVVQPFKQAHREIYPLTDAERQANIYSNRFAGHILRQHQSVALARLRGWRATLRISADVPNDEPTHLRMADFGIAGELWTEKAGGDDAEFTDSLAYVFISTDRVRFRRCAGTDCALGEAIPLSEIPPRIFSELMRDVDLLVGVASIGNDPTWSDGGADAEHPSQWRRAAREYWNGYSAAALDVAGENRRQLLAELIPMLAIADRCTLTDRYLTVRGLRHTYRIHLGSANVLMDDHRYLCIVSRTPRDDPFGGFLPFEGDRMLSLILSKAIMLAADDKITDTAILSQLARYGASGPN